MNREVHVRFCEGVGVRFPRATRPVAESFFALLKRERVHRRRYRTRAEATTDLFHYIEVFYNRQRRHAFVGHQSPERFERDGLIKGHSEDSRHNAVEL